MKAKDLRNKLRDMSDEELAEINRRGVDKPYTMQEDAKEERCQRLDVKRRPKNLNNCRNTQTFSKSPVVSAAVTQEGLFVSFA